MAFFKELLTVRFALALTPRGRAVAPWSVLDVQFGCRPVFGDWRARRRLTLRRTTHHAAWQHRAGASDCVIDPFLYRATLASPAGNRTGRRSIVPFVMGHDLVQRTAPQSPGQESVERQGPVAEPNGRKPHRRVEPAPSNHTPGPTRFDPGDRIAQPGDVG